MHNSVKSRGNVADQVAGWEAGLRGQPSALGPWSGASWEQHGKLCAFLLTAGKTGSQVGRTELPQSVNIGEHCWLVHRLTGERDA